MKLLVLLLAANFYVLSSSVAHKKRVIGGKEVKEGQWPWLVSIQAETEKDWKVRKVFCGASLLNDRWILSAAHCFRTRHGSELENPNLWHARLGDTELKHGILDRIANNVGDFFGNILDVDEWKDWYIKFEKIVIHPKYNPRTLIKLKSAVPSGPNEVNSIQRVKLPAQGNMSFPLDGQHCVMKGWGCTRGGMDTTFRLCAGYNLKSKGICPGDSGGPLSCKSESGKWVQAGIASFTSSTRPGNVPGAFTRVSQYVDWIQKTIKY